jgi:RNA polymerase sigma-70 factor (ECF subfamily)
VPNGSNTSAHSPSYIQVSEISVQGTERVRQEFEESAPRLWRAIYAFAGDREVANDAVAEAFAQALRRGDEIRNLRAWLWRAAFRIASGELKRRTRQTDVPESIVDDDQQLERINILFALRRLTQTQRAVIILRYYAGYTSIEIGGVLGLNAGTARIHLLRARRALAKLLEEDI